MSIASLAGQRGPSGWLAEAGRHCRQPEACPGAGSSLRRALPAGRSRCHLVFDTGGYALLGAVVLALIVIKMLTARKGSFKKAIGVQSSMY